MISHKRLKQIHKYIIDFDSGEAFYLDLLTLIEALRDVEKERQLLEYVIVTWNSAIHWKGCIACSITKEPFEEWKTTKISSKQD